MDTLSPIDSNILNKSSQELAPNKSPDVFKLSPILMSPTSLSLQERIFRNGPDGRESFGILAPGFNTDNEFPSLNSILYLDNSDPTRESLGILPPGFDRDASFLNTTDKEFPSLKNILYLEDSDPGRESLGILQLNKLDVDFGDENVPDIMLSLVDTNDVSNKVLNTGFIFSSPSRCLSFTMSPSKIFALNKNESNTSGFSPRSRSRISSQPLLGINNRIENGKFFWSTGKPARSKMLSTSFCGGKLLFDYDKDDMFFDSVFIEGSHIAQKIADGSFLNEHYDNGPLDSTPQPDWPSDLDETDAKDKIVPNTDTVFKTVDKLLPNPLPTGSKSNLKSSKSSSTSSISKDVKEMLQNLSEIFNSSTKSEQQISQGNLMLKSLEEILNNIHPTRENHSDDSGHSSIIGNESEKDKQVFNEVFEKNTKVADKMDASPEAEDNKPKERLSQSLSNKNLPQIKLKRNSSASSMNVDAKKVNSNEHLPGSKNSSTSSSSGGPVVKVKTTNAATKKGPLKAFLPVKQMKRGSSTPDQIEQKTVQDQLKKPNTPINEPKLKPQATSTPTVNHRNDHQDTISSKLRKPNLNRSNSLNEKQIRVQKDINTTPKLKRPSFSATTSKDKLNSSSSIPTRFQENFIAPRRNSVTEGIVGGQMKMKRSNSLGKETGLMSSLRKVRENILKSPYYDNKTGILGDSNNRITNDAERKITFRKSLNSSVKLKKSEKENFN